MAGSSCDGACGRWRTAPTSPLSPPLWLAADRRHGHHDGGTSLRSGPGLPDRAVGRATGCRSALPSRWWGRSSPRSRHALWPGINRYGNRARGRGRRAPGNRLDDVFHRGEGCRGDRGDVISLCPFFRPRTQLLRAAKPRKFSRLPEMSFHHADPRPTVQNFTPTTAPKVRGSDRVAVACSGVIDWRFTYVL